MNVQVKGKYNWLKHLDFIVIDLLVLIFSFTVGYLFTFNRIDWWSQNEWITLIFSISVLDLLITFIISPYSGVFKKTFSESIINYIFLAIYNLGIDAFVLYVLKIGSLFSRGTLLITYLVYFVLGSLIKNLWKKLLEKGILQSKTPLYIVCEPGKEDEVIDNCLTDYTQKYDIVGSSNTDGFIKDLLSKNAREVLIAIKAGSISKETYEQLIANGIGIHISIESTIGIQTEDQSITKVGSYKTLTVGEYTFTPRQLFYLTIKRLFDILCGLIGLIVLIPLSIIIKLLYLHDGDTKSIFYRQKRIGQYGKVIKIFKFRSMVPDADEVLKELLKDPKYRKEWEENQKFENDPRITKVGNFLRKTSLDELPQLINVLIGDMSLVGPRPLVKGELESHDGLKLYQQVKPGITGWWGCNGRSNTDYRTRLELEYFYVKNCSLYLDIACIFKTVFVVLKRDGSK